MNTTSKKGYKFTEEFGLIPNDWEVAKLNNIAQINPKTENLPNEFVYIDLESVEKGRLLYKNKIFKCNAPSRAQRLLSKGDILFQTVRPYQMNNYLFNLEGNFVASTGYAQIRSLQNNHFLYCYFNSQKFINFVMEKCTGSSYPAINPTDLSNLPILLPPLPEQEKIAEVLSDVDSLIDKTLGLINKKKDLKTATMQKLLTPKDDWECKTLGECVQVQGGYSFNSEKFTKNGIPIIRISNIYNNGVIIDNETVYYEPFNINKEFIINKGDILIAMSGATTGKVGIYKYGRQSYLNQRVGKFVATNKYIVMQYIEQVLNSNQFINELNKSIAQGAQPNISSKQIEEIQFYFPTKSEQEKIATILSDMDLEIETLQKELGKYQDLKIGIMQQLLTGQVRLLS